MSNKATIITEASTKVGYGHLFRTIAIAQSLLKRGISIHFYIIGDRKLEAIISKYITSFRITFSDNVNDEEILNLHSDVYLIDLHKDSLETISFLTENRNFTTVLIIDSAFLHYAQATDFIFSIGYQDYESKEEDRFINAAKVVKQYSGRKSLILRKEFINNSKYIVQNKANNLLVTMGGGDPFRITEFVAKSISFISNPIEVSFVVGPGFSAEREKELKELCERSHHNIIFYKDIEQMAEVMVAHDLAIINGGNTRFELAALGVPFLTLSIDKTQLSINNKLANASLGKSLGIFSELKVEFVGDQIKDILNDTTTRVEMSSNMQQKEIGRGAEWIYNVVWNKENLFSFNN